MSVNLLLVDDEVVDLEWLRRRVLESGLNVRVAGTAHSGFQALKLMEYEPIDLILSDIRMPIMTGTEFARKAKTIHPKVKIVFISGHEDFGYAKEAIEINASGYLLKPVEDQELFRILTEQVAKIEQELEQDRSFTETLSLVNEELLLRWFEERTSAPATSHVSSVLAHYLEKGTSVALVEIDDLEWKMRNLPPEEQRAETRKITRTIKTFASDIRLGTVIEGQGNRFAILAAVPESRFNSLLKELVEHVNRSTSRTVTIGVGRYASNETELHESFRQALAALGAKWLLGKNRIIQGVIDAHPQNTPGKCMEEKVNRMLEAILDYVMFIVWRKEWMNEYESPWSIFEKVSLANHINRTEILKTLGNAEVKKIKKNVLTDSRRELIKLSGFDLNTLKQYLGVDLSVLNKSVISNLLKPVEYYQEPISTWFPQSLNWCPECIKGGYHSWLHQFSLFHSCPIHQIKLLSSCPKCLNRIPFLLSDLALNEPFTCKCGFKLADIGSTPWSQWKMKVEIADVPVSKWIAQGKRDDSNRLLFSPLVSSIQHFTLEPKIQSKCFFNVKATSTQDYSYRDEFKNDLYKQNCRCFKTIDHYVRKKFIKKHLKCILMLQELRKNENEEFPPICPYAYAYVFWKQTLLGREHFYNNLVISRRRPGITVATELIEDIIDDYKNRLFAHTNLSIYDNREMFHWVINRVTSELCLNYFYEWLKIAVEGAEQISVPNRDKLDIMLQNSIPIAILKHNSDVSQKQKIEIILPNVDRRINLNEFKCTLSTKTMKKLLFKMNSFKPLSVAMRIYENPSDENKRIESYVKQYVMKLRI